MPRPPPVQAPRPPILIGGGGRRVLTVAGQWADIVGLNFALTKGVIDSKDIVYFATLLVVGLFLTQRSVESVRWR